MQPDTRPAALFFIPTLGAGGAERVCLQYINNLKRYRPLLMLQFRSGELMSELRRPIPIIMINSYTGYGEKRRARRRRLHHAIRRKRRRLQVRLRHGMKRLSPLHRALRRQRRIFAVYRRYARRRAANLVANCFGDQSVLALEKAARGLRRILTPFGFLIALIANVLRALLSLIVAPFRLLLGLPAFKTQAFVWGMRSGSGASSTKPKLAERLRLVSDALFLLRQARLLAVAAKAKQCKIIVSFLPFTNVIAILAKMLFNRDLKVVINVHSVKSRIIEDSPVYDQYLLKLLVRLFYRRADHIIAVAEGIKRDLVHNFGIPDNQIEVIHNPTDVSGICESAREPADHPWVTDKQFPLVVAVGRLVQVKGFDLLIRAFSQVPESTGARLMLIGNGPERETLERLAVKMGVENRISFAGFQKNPWKLMKQADCLALSSRTEGLPMVIGEALALELPVIATDCSQGVREYLGDSEYGMIVVPDDANALAWAITELLSNEDLKMTFKRRSGDRIKRFDLPHVVESFENSLHQVAER